MTPCLLSAGLGGAGDEGLEEEDAILVVLHLASVAGLREVYNITYVKLFLSYSFFMMGIT
jgi:hypothetical protein